MITISIPHDKTFSFEECLWYLDRNYDECLYSIKNNKIKKALKIGNSSVILDISGNGNDLTVRIIADKVTSDIRTAIKDHVVDWFDMEKDVKPFYKLLKKQDRLAYMISDFAGLRLVGIPDLFEALSWCIIGQQINLSFAHKVKRQLVEKYGEKVEYDNTFYYLFPHYEIIANVSIEELKAMQFSTRKAEYLITVARAFVSKEISKEKLLALPDLASKQQVLTNLKGIGIWTANYALMKCLREPTSIPYGDAERFFAQFPGWQSYMVFYLWRSLSHPAFRKPKKH